MTKKLYKAIKILRKAKASDKSVQKLSESDIKALCEVCANLLHGNLPLTKASTKKLTHFKHPIQVLADRRKSNKQKKEVINQQGGFLSAVAGIALPILTNILLSTIKNKTKGKK